MTRHALDELNSALAKIVGLPGDDSAKDGWSPATRLDHAWQLVRRACELHPQPISFCLVSTRRAKHEPLRWSANFGVGLESIGHARSESECLAICAAAAKALGRDGPVRRFLPAGTELL